MENHYRLLTGLPTEEPTRRVDKVDLLPEEKKVTIFLSWPKRTEAPCPECGKLRQVHDRTKERTWRHLDVMQFAALAKAHIPRSACPEHGAKTIKTPWAASKRRFTLLFEQFALEALSASKSLDKTAGLLKLSWDELHLIMEKAAERGLNRRPELSPELLGIDEKSFRKGHKYLSVLTDINQGAVIDVVEGRDKASSKELLEKIPENNRKEVKAVAMDTREAY